MTVPLVFSADETCDVGVGGGTAVTPDYPEHGNAFTGKVKWVQLDIGDVDEGHLVTVDDLYRAAMARQ